MAKAPANITSVSPLHNRPAPRLVDQLGALKVEIAELGFAKCLGAAHVRLLIASAVIGFGEPEEGGAA
jgi:hypothetical protein